MQKIMRGLCLFAVLLLCFVSFASCTDENGNVSGNASDGIVSDLDSPGDDSPDDMSPDDMSPDDMSPDDLSPDDMSPGGDETIDINDDDLGDLRAFPMTFTKLSDSLYRMECVAPDGNTLLLTFNKKDWGTYNIGSWSVVSGNNGTATLAGGGTDWEYVFRAGKTSSSWVWSGGNHDNELLVGIDFYDGLSGEKLSLASNAPVQLENLRIIEKTKLHWGNTADTYCDVVRTYTVIGSRISLAVSYTYTQDCYHWLSYTCMFPVWKNYGRYCEFFDVNGDSLGSVTTYPQNDPAFTGTFYRGYAATTCIITGDTNPSYKFKVSVSTVADSLDNFKNADKTFYWDMNASQNKLYFSKYSMDYPTLVKAGSAFNTKSTWIFYVD